MRLALLTLLLACGPKDTGDSISCGDGTHREGDECVIDDTDADTDADSDADTDADSDADTDTDTDTDVPFCDRDLDDSAPAGPDCVTSALSCGDLIEATTSGGSNVADADTYVAWYCTTSPQDYDSSERVYEMSFTERTTVTVHLDAACEDVDLMVMDWEEDTCPTIDSRVNQCEHADGEGDDEIEIDAFDGDRYLLWVESRYGADTNFKLSVACEVK